MKRKYFGKVSSISNSPDKNGYYKLTLTMTDELFYSKIKGKKILLLSEEDTHKYRKGDYYLFQVEYAPETNQLLAGYEKDYDKGGYKEV